MSDEKKVMVKCPNEGCGKSKEISIPNYLLQNKKYGTLKIQLHAGVCCEHEFIAFIDRKGIVRGYESINTTIDLAEFSNRTTGEKIYLRDLIKMMGDYAISFLLHAVIIDVPIVILRAESEKNRSSGFNTLLNSYLPDEYQNPMMITSIFESGFKKVKIDKALILSSKGLIANTPWSEIEYTLENNIMVKALDILDDESQSVIIQQDIAVVLEKASFINDHLKKIDQIYEDDLKDMIMREFTETAVDDNEIILLKHIIQNRFKGSVSKIKIRSFSKLKEGLW